MQALVVLLVSSSLSAATPIVERDLPYVSAGHERQKLDLYAPANAKNCPIVVWIHGGGWQGGDKKEVKHKPQWFVDQGFLFVSLNYRLLPHGVTIDEMAHDVARAIRWVHDHAAKHGGNPNRMFVMGHSAGAQLAALVCTDDRYLKGQRLPLSIVKGCVLVDGDTYDVPLQIRTVEQRRADIYRKKFGDVQSQARLSPVTHVAKGKAIPPVLILHVADHPETQLQSRRLVQLLRDAGVPARAHAATGKDHVTLNDDLGLPDDPASRALLDFVKEQLAK